MNVRLRRWGINMNRNESSFTTSTRARRLSRHVITPVIIIIIIIVIILIIIAIIVVMIEGTERSDECKGMLIVSGS